MRLSLNHSYYVLCVIAPSILLTLPKAELVALSARIVIQRAHGHAGLASVVQSTAVFLIPLVLFKRVLRGAPAGLLSRRRLAGLGRRRCAVPAGDTSY